VRDGGVRGVVIRLCGEFERIEFLERDRVHAGAAVRVPQLVSQCAERGLGGDESLVGIPGTVGGALVMNAGTREGEIGALVESVDVLDPDQKETKSLPRSELEFSYRASNLQGRVVVGATLQLKPGDKRVIMGRVQQFQQKRRQTQPIHTFNVGSTFKNPPGRFAAQLIEEVGLKGLTCGGARISPMHANFIENFSGAKASDVLTLVDRVRAKVRQDRGVELELEMKVIGED
jgi:UDP-N-acetylmuramate dehydrogenase